ncbi:hypothetical protein ACFL6U_18500 [Planctomycetota bacterium]
MMDKQNNLEKAMNSLKNLPVPQGPSPALVDQTLAAIDQNDTGSTFASRICRRTRLRVYWKMAVAASILIGIGFWAGRLNRSPELSEAQQAALRDSLLESLAPTLVAQVQDQLAPDWQKALVFTYGRLMSEVDQQVDYMLNQHALQVLAVSETKTQQALRHLVEQIRENEAQQQARFASAITQLEYDHRLRDNQVRNLAGLTHTNLKYTEDLISFLAHEPGSADDPNRVMFFPKRY